MHSHIVHSGELLATQFDKQAMDVVRAAV
jgi:hypothetical protein